MGGPDGILGEISLIMGEISLIMEEITTGGPMGQEVDTIQEITMGKGDLMGVIPIMGEIRVHHLFLTKGGILQITGLEISQERVI